MSRNCLFVMPPTNPRHLIEHAVQWFELALIELVLRVSHPETRLLDDRGDKRIARPDGGLRLSAKLNGHDPYRYLKDVLERLPTQPSSRLDDLLPHRWQH